jgi:hypothetical protein
MGRARKRLKQDDPQPVATHRNRFAAHGKEEVDLGAMCGPPRRSAVACVVLVRDLGGFALLAHDVVGAVSFD